MNTATDLAPAPVSFGASIAPEPAKLHTASLGNRVSASLVDAGATVAAGIAGALVGACLGGVAGLLDGGSAQSLLETGTNLGAMIGLFGFAALQVYLISISGQTVGKKWFRIRIVRTNGRAAGFIHGWGLRSLIPAMFTYFFTALMLPAFVFVVADLAFVFSSQRRTLHDRIAGTRVVEV